MKKMEAEPVTKKSKKGAGLYDSYYKEEWTESYPLGPVNGNTRVFYCIPCKKSVSCMHQGLDNVKQHCLGKSHMKNTHAIAQSRKISFKPAKANDEKQIRPEVLHTNFIVQRNISFLTADHMPPLYRAMFSGSNIAKIFRCKRTKTTCILKHYIQE